MISSESTTPHSFSPSPSSTPSSLSSPPSSTPSIPSSEESGASFHSNSSHRPHSAPEQPTHGRRLLDTEEETDELSVKLKSLELGQRSDQVVPQVSSAPSSYPSSPSSSIRGTKKISSTASTLSPNRSQTSSSSTTPRGISVVSSPAMTSAPVTPSLTPRSSFSDRPIPSPLVIPSHAIYSSTHYPYYLVQRDGQYVMAQNVDPTGIESTVVPVSQMEPAFISGSWIPTLSTTQFPPTHVRLTQQGTPVNDYMATYPMGSPVPFSGIYADPNTLRTQSISASSRSIPQKQISEVATSTPPSSTTDNNDSMTTSNPSDGATNKNKDVTGVVSSSSREVYREMKMFYSPQRSNRSVNGVPFVATTATPRAPTNGLMVSDPSVYDPSKASAPVMSNQSYAMNYVYYDPTTNVTYSIPTTTAMSMSTPMIPSLGVLSGEPSQTSPSRGVVQVPVAGEWPNSVYFSRYRGPRVRPGVCLFTFHLPPEITDDELFQLFTTCGRVLSAKVMRDRHTAESKGYGFVNMSTQLEAERAIEKLHGSRWRNKYLKVSFKKKRYYSRS